MVKSAILAYKLVAAEAEAMSDDKPQASTLNYGLAHLYELITTTIFPQVTQV